MFFANSIAITICFDLYLSPLEYIGRVRVLASYNLSESSLDSDSYLLLNKLLEFLTTK